MALRTISAASICNLRIAHLGNAARIMSCSGQNESAGAAKVRPLGSLSNTFLLSEVSVTDTLLYGEVLRRESGAVKRIRRPLHWRNVRMPAGARHGAGRCRCKKGGGPDGPPPECPEAGAVLEVDLQIREHEPSQGVVHLWIRIAVEEWRRQAPGRQDRRILVHHVVDADLQGDVAQDLVAGDQIEVVTGSRVLDGGAEHAREERRGVRELDLGIADVAPPRLQSDAVPWGHPAGRKRVPPLRQRVATGRTEIACAVVITRARIRLDVQRGGVRPYQIEAQCAQGAERLRVIERYVDAALLLE